MPSWPLPTSSAQLYATDEIFSLPRCQNNLTLKKLKSHLEFLTGIPIHFQRLQYLDEADLPDESTLKDNDTVPGGRITMLIWQQGGWGHLVAAAAKGETLKLSHLGVTEDSGGATPQAELLGPEQKKEWAAHPALVALFVASHRGHVETAEFLLKHGADLLHTPLGRTALLDQCDCTELLLSYGAQALGQDSEGQTAVSLACLWGQKQSENTMVSFQWKKRSPGTGPPSRAVNPALRQTSGPVP
ncbi:LOW QUALITY PROTEIN: ankyrin repeat domain-containing protein 60 [Podargus strigoides]